MSIISDHRERIADVSFRDIRQLTGLRGNDLSQALDRLGISLEYQRDFRRRCDEAVEMITSSGCKRSDSQ